MGKNKTVVVGLSGGVDSSLAAMLLKANYEVIGVTLKLHGKEDFSLTSDSCGNKTAVLKAQKIATELQIPLHIIDCSQDFVNNTLKKCWTMFEKGCTPNPCYICNSAVKFATLLKVAETFNAHKIATGHYARISFDSQNRPVLQRGIDTTKDQSYFLSGLSPETLSHTLFPLGDLKKSEVIKLAAQHGLSSVKQKESQDLCFTAEEGHFSNTLQKEFKGINIPGIFVDESGCTLGTHNGIHQFTIGQRRGLGIATGNRVKITEINPSSGVIVVSDKKGAACKESCKATCFQWSRDAMQPGDKVSAQVRYRQTPAEATIAKVLKNSIYIDFNNPVFGVTPGQILVLYKDDCVLGSGIISR